MEVLLYDSTVCRLCAEENADGIYLYSNEENEPALCNLINKYLPLKVSDDGKYPCTICPGCNIQLDAAIQFFELVITGQTRLRELWRIQQTEIRRFEREAARKETNPLHKNDNEVNTDEENKEGSEILVQILPNGLYAPEHELSLRSEGREKPRRKRGRPPKSHSVLESVTEDQINEDAKKEEIVLENKQECEIIEADGRRRRRRKVPTRFREAVQGKELERIFREEGVIDENELTDEAIETLETSENVAAVGGTITAPNDSSEVIGHLESKEGQDLGELVIVNRHRGRGRPKKRKFVCDVCGRGFKHAGRFQAHKAFHKGVKYECVECQTRFINKEELANHQTEAGHTGNLVVEGLCDEEGDKNQTEATSDIAIIKIPCSQCEKFFMSKQSLEVHMKAIHEGQKPFVCNICDKSFAYIASLKGHMVSHEQKSEKGYTCDICGKVLNHPSSVIYHKQSEHNNGRRFVCNKCGKSFKHKQLLQRHQLVHSSDRPYRCGNCGARFKAKSNLLNHQLTHTGLKKYFCERCGQQFAHKTSLTLHYRWHSGHKPYQCTVCKKLFSQNGNLHEHMRIHTGVKPFCCDYCGRKFTTSSQFKLHVKRHTGERPWQCEFCSKSFLHKDTWKCHTRRHLGQRPYKCHVCQRAFTEQWALKKHIRLHTGEKPYVCDICSKAFSDCSNLNKHKKVHAARAGAGKPMVPSWNAKPLVTSNTKNSLSDPASRMDVFKLDKINDPANQVYLFYDSKEQNETNVDNATNVGDAVSQKSDNSVDFTSSGKEINLSESDLPPQSQLQVTDEEGNPINFTTQDGQQLRVTTYDGEHLQVTTPDGTVIPIELNVTNGTIQTSQEASISDGVNSMPDATGVIESNVTDDTSLGVITISDEKENLVNALEQNMSDETVLNGADEIEFLMPDGQKVQFVTSYNDEGLKMQYFAIV